MDDGKAAALLIGLAPKKEGGASPAAEEAPEEAEDMDGLDVAAQDAFDAVKRGDREGFVSAFKAAAEIAASRTEV